MVACFVFPRPLTFDDAFAARYPAQSERAHVRYPFWPEVPLDYRRSRGARVLVDCDPDFVLVIVIGDAPGMVIDCVDGKVASAVDFDCVGDCVNVVVGSRYVDHKVGTPRRGGETRSLEWGRLTAMIPRTTTWSIT